MFNELKCNKEKCISNYNKICNILNNTDFGKKECPFYKEKKDTKEESKK